MFDIEEKVLELPDVAEAEVIKFGESDKERPAIVVVPKEGAKSNLEELLRKIYSIEIAGMQHLIGVRFIKNFKTHPVTSKRDYLCLTNIRDGYYSINEDNDIVITDVEGNKTVISGSQIEVLEE